MMQNQEAGRTNGSKTSDFIETHKTANEQEIVLKIDFDNVEDILDFSAPSITKPSTIKTPKLPPNLHKSIAGEPIKLPTNSNFVTDKGRNSKNDEAKKKFQCIFCGSKFIQFQYLNCHLQVHTKDKPYFCPICRKRFSSNDYMLTHSYRHHKDKVHHCIVCGKAYFNLKKIAIHCHSHDDSEYIKLAIGTDDKAELQKEIPVAESDASVATSSEQFESISSVMIEKLNTSTDDECITCVKNPIYLSYHKAISINHNATSVPDDASSSDSLIVSINLVNFVP